MKKTKSFKEKDLFCNSFNFGPKVESNKKVEDLVNEIIKNWKGNWVHINQIMNFMRLINLI